VNHILQLTGYGEGVLITIVVTVAAVVAAAGAVIAGERRDDERRLPIPVRVKPQRRPQD
jgi:hypothetical protein|tara:strand:+ start:427 stop:603 length:177 start_codon:yes stop_codon:yes gene_type:complete